MSMETASIAQYCKWLHLTSIGAQFASLAEEARQQNHSHLRYLDALLGAEVEERERRSIELRLKDAHLPRIKTLEEFDFAQSPHIPASRIRALAEGSYLARAEPVLLIGEPGTGKSHLATGLAIAACRQRRTRAFHHGCRAGQSTRRSTAGADAQPNAGTLGAHRVDRAR